MKEKQKPEVEDKPGWWSRNTIAFIITFGVMISTVYIAIASIHFRSEPNFNFIGESLLPLWGTWLGTVLAFYFGKSNFEAASKSYQEAIKSLTPEEKIAKLLVKDAMLPVEKIEFLDYEKEKKIAITEILNYSRFEKYNRYAVFDPNKVLKYMIHRSVFLEFLYNKSLVKTDGGNAAGTASPKLLTLDSLLATDDLKIKALLNRGYGFVPLNATVLDAKRVIDSIAECQDVFITPTGAPTEAVVGLLTNTMIFEKAKV